MVRRVLSTADWRDLEGQVIDDRYYLTGFLGAGSFAGVFRADHVVQDTLIKTVAAKLIPEQESTRLDVQLSEATVWANLDHPSILRCFSVGHCRLVEKGYLYLVTELADDSLDKRIARGPMPQEDVLKLAEDLLGGLKYLHSFGHGLVHRDVKPANVLLASGHWNLADFGTARQVGVNSDGDKISLGTPAYAPPECAEGIETSAWDMWSLGVLLYEALTSRLPFQGSSAAELWQSALSGKLSIPENITRPLSMVIRGCLAKNYQERLSAERACDILKQKLSHHPRQLRVPGDHSTIMDAVANANSEDEIVIGSGVWDERIVVDLPLTISGDKRADPAVVRACDGDAITVKGVKLRLNDVTLQSSAGCGLMAERNSSVEAKNLQITLCRRKGLIVHEGGVVKLAASRIDHCRQSNCEVSFGATMSAEDTVFEHSQQGCGVLAYGSFGAKRCSFFGNANAGVWTAKGGRVQIQESNIEYNLQRGVYAARGSDVSVMGTSFVKNGPRAIEQMDGASVKVENNTLR